jgi:hypothetical protein
LEGDLGCVYCWLLASLSDWVKLPTLKRMSHEEYRVDPEQTDRVFQAWAMGYMSGINVRAEARSEGIYDLSAITPDQIKRYLRQYCDAHPLADYVDGVSELLKSLPIVKPEH